MPGKLAVPVRIRIPRHNEPMSKTKRPGRDQPFPTAALRPGNRAWLFFSGPYRGEP